MKLLRKLDCWLEELYNLFRYQTRIDGHDWLEEEVHENVTVIISRCEHCGKQEISWKR